MFVFLFMAGHPLVGYALFDIKFRYNTLGSNPLDEWSARRRDLYLTKQNTQKR